MVFAEKDSPVYLAGAFDIVAAMIEAEQKVEHSFRRIGDLALQSLGPQIPFLGCTARFVPLVPAPDIGEAILREDRGAVRSRCRVATSNQTQFSADCITTTFGFEFLVHTPEQSLGDFAPAAVVDLMQACCAVGDDQRIGFAASVRSIALDVWKRTH